MFIFPVHAPIALRRTVRLAVAMDAGTRPGSLCSPTFRAQGFAAMPWIAHHEVLAECRGVPDPHTGYLLGIQEIDAAVRAGAGPLLADWLNARSTRPDAATAARLLAEATQRHLPGGIRLHSLLWLPSPFSSIAWSTDMPEHAILAERFEFSASHRLHCPDRSLEENRRLFGKCNHPNGHGHNYRIEVGIRVPAGAGAAGFPEGRLDAAVRREVIDRFDHKHLNVDCAEFARLNPSVENIARVCHALLEPALGADGAQLHHVTVWETEKTSATYPVR